MTIQTRIFLESKSAVIPGLPVGHLYLVLRQVDVAPDGTYANEHNVATDRVIRGGIGSGLLEVNSDTLLAAGEDHYTSEETPGTRNSVDITGLLITKSGLVDVSTVWSAMSQIGAGINNVKYDYDIPGPAENQTANSNAVILSVLNAINVDLRTIANPNGTGRYVDTLSGSTFLAPLMDLNRRCSVGSQINPLLKRFPRHSILKAGYTFSGGMMLTIF